jgi:hypothetical protein
MIWPVLTACSFRPPQKSFAMKQADGELLELGEQLARVQPELARMLRWVDEVWEMYAAEVRRRGTWPEDAAEWTWRDAAAYCAARECVERETEIGAGYVRAMDALDMVRIEADVKTHAAKPKTIEEVLQQVESRHRRAQSL